MISLNKADDLLNASMDVLSGDLAASTPQSGTGIIDQWLQQLREAANAEDIVNALERVKTQLKSEQINPGELGQLMNQLADQTRTFSTNLGSEGDMATRLEGLSSALREAAGKLA